MKVLGIGDNVCDKYIHLKTMYPGGQALNFTVYASMLGVKSAFIGVFGTDEIAAHMQKTLDEFEVDHSRSRTAEGENGFSRVTLVDGDRVFLGSNKGGVLKTTPWVFTEQDLDYIRTFSLIHTSNNSYIDDQLPLLAATGVPISYDFSGSWRMPEKVDKVAGYAEYAFLSCGSMPLDEVKAFVLSLKEKGFKNIVATRGSEGSLFFDGTDFYEQAPDYVDPVDTLGAGDSFATAFLTEMAEAKEKNPELMAAKGEEYKQEVVKALKKAAEFSAKTCLVRGAFGHGKEFEPTEEELK